MNDPRTIETLTVHRGSERVGTLARTKRGAVFEYSAEFFETHRTLPGGVAVHLPCAQQRSEVLGTNLHAYFAGLLPEGLRLKALTDFVKTSEDDLFSLLVASGTSLRSLSSRQARVVVKAA